MWDDDRQWPIFIFQWVEANNQFIELLLTLATVFLDENLRGIRFVLPFQDLRFVNKGTVLSYLIIISFIENTLQQHGIYHDMIYHDIYIYYLILGNPIPQLVSQFLPILIIDGPEILNFRVHPLLHTRSRFVFAHKSSTPKSQTVSFSPCVKIITSPNLRLNYSSFSAI
jgi:hypothetical protein